LHAETLRGVWIGAAVMRRNHGVRTQVRLAVIAVRQTEDLMQQDPMPATQTL
jgi:hypothetical protein